MPRRIERVEYLRVMRLMISVETSAEAMNAAYVYETNVTGSCRRIVSISGNVGWYDIHCHEEMRATTFMIREQEVAASGVRLSSCTVLLTSSDLSGGCLAEMNEAADMAGASASPRPRPSAGGEKKADRFSFVGSVGSDHVLRL